MTDWTDVIWKAVGFFGQALFAARFLVQWISSERLGKSVIPLAFWFLSIGGGGILFAYAVYIQDPVFILGQTFGILVYSRNLYLIYRERKAAAFLRAREEGTTEDTGKSREDTEEERRGS